QGCFDYPIDNLKLGCRRNFEGSVFQTDHCNDDPSTDVVDLPIVRNCRDAISADDGKTCTSNYCIYRRAANVIESFFHSKK
ncbi:hypothetical protein PMAYCL1PPCAC_14761, partial [Pristionchus mayeri]